MRGGSKTNAGDVDSGVTKSENVKLLNKIKRARMQNTELWRVRHSRR